MTGTPPIYYPGPSAPQYPTPAAPPQQPYRHCLPSAGTSRMSQPGGSGGGGGSSSSSSSSNSGAAGLAQPRSLLPPPHAPQISEEDECPVCHRELPQRTLPNFESLREAHITVCITTHSSSTTAGGSSASSPPRRTGMFPYLATEKDCVDSAECTICLEEFEVGVAMARLECLCRFHRTCIKAWFVNHPGCCPVHQHDSFGY